MENNNLEVFFDYACPFCLKGHENLKVIKEKHPELQITWRPCEAHPRPETHGLHSDLCIHGLLYALDCGGDIWLYHDRMYKAAVTDRANIEDINVLASYLADVFADLAGFKDALKSGKYASVAYNRYAYEEQGVWAVPSYRMNGRKLDAVEGVGVTLAELEKFVSGQK